MHAMKQVTNVSTRNPRTVHPVLQENLEKIRMLWISLNSKHTTSLPFQERMLIWERN